jgi:hypothetical protein
MTRVLASILAFACALGTTSCRDDDLVAIAGNLRGVICSETTGFPVEDMRVSITVGGVQSETRTDKDGEFRFSSLPEGQGSLHIHQEGDDRTAEIEITDKAVFEDTACRGLPGPPGTGGIRGQVCNRHTGELIDDAAVKIIMADGASIATTTDDDGRFLFDAVPVGEHVLNIDAPNFTQSVLIDVKDGEITEINLGECEEPAYNEGFLKGHLCEVAGDLDDAGDAAVLVGADVFGFLADGSVVTTTTNFDGKFELGPLAEGHVLVRIVRDPDIFHEIEAEVVAGAEVVVINDTHCGEPFEEPPPPPPPPPPDEVGRIVGSVCTPDGAAGISGADVWILLEDGERMETHTDSNGDWELNDVPPGNYVVHVQAGVFGRSHHVTLEGGETFTIPAGECELQETETKIAVVSGSYDDVGTVLLDVGIPSEQITTYDGFSWVQELFGDINVLRTFDIVFINCGASEFEYVTDTTIQANLRQYISEGGRLNASDWAYDVIESTFPTYIDFHNDDLTRDSAQVGSEQVQSGSIIDSDLSGALGFSNVTLNYPLGAWAIATGASADVNVYIRAPAETFDFETLPNVPHTMSFRVGDGRVTYSSFHQEPGINVQQEQILHYLMFML